MPLYTTPDEGRSVLEELSSSTGAASLATASKVFMENPTVALTRVVGQIYENQTSDDPLVPVSELQPKLKDLGVELELPEQGMTQKQFDYLVKIQQNTDKYNAVISRAPSGFLSNAALFGTAFAASALDPINIGSAFIPVYGQARYTSLLANAVKPLSRAAIRARAGFVEGAIGAAYVEPLNYGLSQYEQRDYTLANSLENMIFGGGIGAGLHAGVGAISDSFRLHGTTERAQPIGINAEIYDRIDRDVRNTASRIAITQVLNGYFPDVESVLKFDPNYRLLNEHFSNIVVRNPGNKLNPTVDAKPYDPFEKPVPNTVILKSFIPEDIKITTDNPRQINPQTFAATSSDVDGFRVFATTTIKEAEKIQSSVYRKSGDILAIKKTDDGRFILLKEFADKPFRDTNGSIIAFDSEEDAIRAITKTRNKVLKAKYGVTNLREKNVSPVPFMDNGKVRYALFENADPSFVAAAKARPDFVQFDLNRSNTKQALPYQEPNEQQLAAVQKAAQEQIQIKNMRLADVETVELADKIYNTLQKMEERPIDMPTAKKEADEFAEMIRNDAVNRGIENQLDELKVYDDLINDADNYGKAIEAAFNCSIRKAL